MLCCAPYSSTTNTPPCFGTQLIQSSHLARSLRKNFKASACSLRRSCDFSPTTCLLGAPMMPCISSSQPRHAGARNVFPSLHPGNSQEQARKTRGIAISPSRQYISAQKASNTSKKYRLNEIPLCRLMFMHPHQTDLTPLLQTSCNFFLGHCSAGKFTNPQQSQYDMR